MKLEPTIPRYSKDRLQGRVAADLQGEMQLPGSRGFRQSRRFGCPRCSKLTIARFTKILTLGYLLPAIYKCHKVSLGFETVCHNAFEADVKGETAVPHRVGISVSVSAHKGEFPLVSGSAGQRIDPSAGVRLSLVNESEFQFATLMRESLHTSA